MMLSADHDNITVEVGGLKVSKDFYNSIVYGLEPENGRPMLVGPAWGLLICPVAKLDEVAERFLSFRQILAILWRKITGAR